MRWRRDPTPHEWASYLIQYLCYRLFVSGERRKGSAVHLTDEDLNPDRTAGGFFRIDFQYLTR